MPSSSVATITAFSPALAAKARIRSGSSTTTRMAQASVKTSMWIR